MNVKIRVSKPFKRQFKRLQKKYFSLTNDLEKLTEELKLNPELGIPLGKNLFKLRLAIQSKKGGKSGGARVITHLETILSFDLESQNQKIITLVTIYDKSEIGNISAKEIELILKDL